MMMQQQYQQQQHPVNRCTTAFHYPSEIPPYDYHDDDDNHDNDNHPMYDDDDISNDDNKIVNDILKTFSNNICRDTNHYDTTPSITATNPKDLDAPSITTPTKDMGMEKNAKSKSRERQSSWFFLSIVYARIIHFFHRTSTASAAGTTIKKTRQQQQKQKQQRRRFWSRTKRHYFAMTSPDLDIPTSHGDDDISHNHSGYITEDNDVSQYNRDDYQYDIYWDGLPEDYNETSYTYNGNTFISCQRYWGDNTTITSFYTNQKTTTSPMFRFVVDSSAASLSSLSNVSQHRRHQPEVKESPASLLLLGRTESNEQLDVEAIVDNENKRDSTEEEEEIGGVVVVDSKDVLIVEKDEELDNNSDKRIDTVTNDDDDKGVDEDNDNDVNEPISSTHTRSDTSSIHENKDVEEEQQPLDVLPCYNNDDDDDDDNTDDNNNSQEHYHYYCYDQDDMYNTLIYIQFGHQKEQHQLEHMTTNSSIVSSLNNHNNNLLNAKDSIISNQQQCSYDNNNNNANDESILSYNNDTTTTSHCSTRNTSPYQPRPIMDIVFGCISSSSILVTDQFQDGTSNNHNDSYNSLDSSLSHYFYYPTTDADVIQEIQLQCNEEEQQPEQPNKDEHPNQECITTPSEQQEQSVIDEHDEPNAANDNHAVLEPLSSSSEAAATSSSTGPNHEYNAATTIIKNNNNEDEGNDDNESIVLSSDNSIADENDVTLDIDEMTTLAYFEKYENTMDHLNNSSSNNTIIFQTCSNCFMELICVSSVEYMVCLQCKAMTPLISSNSVSSIASPTTTLPPTTVPPTTTKDKSSSKSTNGPRGCIGIGLPANKVMMSRFS